MDDDRARADARLDQVLDAAGMEDPRPLFREQLRALRARDPEAFAAALSYFEQTLVPAIAGGAEPLEQWLAYGRFLAERQGAGRVLAIDPGGRARPCRLPGPAELVLFVPDELSRAALPLLRPRAPSPAQRATLDLLVRGRREL